MANHYKTADEEEAPSSFFSFCTPIIPAWFHSYNVPFAAHVPISATDRAIIVFFNFLMLINTLLVYLLFAIKQQFYDLGFNSRTENLKPMDN